MKEEWKQINGCPNYQISNLGRLKTLEHWTEKHAPRNNNLIIKYHYQERIRNKFNKGGKARCYYITKLVDSNRKVKTVLIHRLVAEAFVPNPRGLNEVDHIDRNPENNRADNLRWVTRSENIRNQGPRKKYEHKEEFYRNHPNYKRKD